MIKLEPIREPIWYPIRSLGVADHKIVDDFEIECTYKNKKGLRLYPYPFRCSMFKAKMFPIKKRKGVPLRIIPINQFELVLPEE